MPHRLILKLMTRFHQEITREDVHADSVLDVKTVQTSKQKMHNATITPAQTQTYGDLPEIMESYVIENEPLSVRELTGSMK